jgi:hypothetical protein
VRDDRKVAAGDPALLIYLFKAAGMFAVLPSRFAAGFWMGLRRLFGRSITGPRHTC